MFDSKLTFFAFIVICGCNCVFGNSVSNDQVECPQICPALYAPVCATDGSNIYKEFSNQCELNASNCRLSRSGVKPYTATEMDWCSSSFVDNLREKFGNFEETKAECLKPCALIYSPICISNGKYRATVGNKCEMEMFNCIVGSEDKSNLFRILKQSEC